MLQTFIDIAHIFVCVVLMLVVLLQQGKGGGMGAAFGGSSAQVFEANLFQCRRGSGNLDGFGARGPGTAHELGAIIQRMASAIARRSAI